MSATEHAPAPEPAASPAAPTAAVTAEPACEHAPEPTSTPAVVLPVVASTEPTPTSAEKAPEPTQAPVPATLPEPVTASATSAEKAHESTSAPPPVVTTEPVAAPSTATAADKAPEPTPAIVDTPQTSVASPNPTSEPSVKVPEPIVQTAVEPEPTVAAAPPASATEPTVKVPETSSPATLESDPTVPSVPTPEPAAIATTAMSLAPAITSPAIPVATATAPPAAAAVTDTTKAAEKVEVKPDTEGVDVKKATEVSEFEEPQNTLTKRFTEAEWKALKEFRKLLPEIFTKAYDEKEDAATNPIKLWGVTIDPAGAEKPRDARVSVVLVKFLRARNLNPSAAKDMMVATLRWRDQFGVEKAMKEEFPDDVFGQLGHVYGKDKEGRPVVYNVYGGNQDLKSVFGDVQRFLRWRVKLMEETVAQLDFETVDQTVQIHDYEGVSLSSRDANSKAAASEASSIFANHYPELLHRKLFVNVPTLMTWIFWLFKPIIPAATLAKMSVVGSGARTIGKDMLPLVDKSQLPKKYGGEADPGWETKKN
ncbi:hypothetical protein HGRIS_004156 [Hohenbuehelia grisea]|uniref:Phosphatidylinositol transfer protein SFH5 n=1 Tax=Hohenbuehelia grisea TaxID=104357 RepID=A0ABR3JI97_9AGAR